MTVLDYNPKYKINTHEPTLIQMHEQIKEGEAMTLLYRRIPVNKCKQNETENHPWPTRVTTASGKIH